MQTKIIKQVVQIFSSTKNSQEKYIGSANKEILETHISSYAILKLLQMDNLKDYTRLHYTTESMSKIIMTKDKLLKGRIALIIYISFI